LISIFEWTSNVLNIKWISESMNQKKVENLSWWRDRQTTDNRRSEKLTWASQLKWAKKAIYLLLYYSFIYSFIYLIFVDNFKCM
jgi:hypothetical protein